MTVTSSGSAWWVRDSATSPAIASRDVAEGSLPFVALIGFTCILLLSPQTFVPALKPLRIAFVAAGSVARLTDVYSKSVIVFWLLANVITTERRLAVMRTVLMLCTMPLAVMALKNYADGTFIAESDMVGRIVSYDAALSSNPAAYDLESPPLTVAHVVRYYALALQTANHDSGGKVQAAGEGARLGDGPSSEQV